MKSFKTAPLCLGSFGLSCKLKFGNKIAVPGVKIDVFSTGLRRPLTTNHMRIDGDILARSKEDTCVSAYFMGRALCIGKMSVPGHMRTWKAPFVGKRPRNSEQRRARCAHCTEYNGKTE